MPVEPDPGDVARHGLVDERLVDGPKASRSAVRISRSRASTKSNGDFSGETRWLTRATAILAGLEANVLFPEFVDDVVLAAYLPAPRVLPMCTSVPARLCSSMRDVLGDVAHPRALLEPLDEAATTAERAGVLFQRRQQRDQRLVEVGDRCSIGHSSSTPRSTEHRECRRARTRVGPAQDTRIEDAQRGLRLPLAFASAAGGSCVIAWSVSRPVRRQLDAIDRRRARAA